MANTNAKSRNGTTDHIKTMIVTLSLAATLSLWALFATQDQRKAIGEQQTDQSYAVYTLDDPGSSDPTLLTLRSVSRPQATPIPQGNPVVIRVGGGGSSGGGGGGGGGGQVSTRTRAS